MGHGLMNNKYFISGIDAFQNAIFNVSLLLGIDFTIRRVHILEQSTLTLVFYAAFFLINFAYKFIRHTQNFEDRLERFNELLDEILDVLSIRAVAIALFLLMIVRYGLIVGGSLYLALGYYPLLLIVALLGMNATYISLRLE